MYFVLDSDQVKQIMYYLMSLDIFIMEKEGKGYNDTYLHVLTDETALSYACVSSVPNTYPRYRGAH